MEALQDTALPALVIQCPARACLGKNVLILGLSAATVLWLEGRGVQLT